MPTSLELATALLPHLKANALRGSGWVRSYGFYAEAIGLDSAKYGKAVGKAMHVLGAACVLSRVPIAPLHYVERADKEWQGIFEGEYLEATEVLPHWNVLAVSARVHPYTDADFAKVARTLEQIIPKHLAHLATPQKLWRFLIRNEAIAGTTWLQRALPAFEEVVSKARGKDSAA